MWNKNQQNRHAAHLDPCSSYRCSCFCRHYHLGECRVSALLRSSCPINGRPAKSSLKSRISTQGIQELQAFVRPIVVTCRMICTQGLRVPFLESSLSAPCAGQRSVGLQPREMYLRGMCHCSADGGPAQSSSVLLLHASFDLPPPIFHPSIR